VGSMGADGLVQIFDRRKDVINRGGYKVYSAEVENVLAAHPGVLECAVIGDACPVLGERVRAIVVPKAGGADALAQALLDHARTHLSDYKLPERIDLRADPLPRNANGKVLKAALRGGPA